MERNMEYQVYEQGGQYRWRLLANNNRNIANGGEAYYNKTDCIAAINLVKSSANATIRDLTQTASTVRRW
jgi:uncharacterized protein